MNSSASSNKKNIISKTLSVLFALLLWQAISLFVSSELLLPSPFQVIKRLFDLLGEAEFFAAVGFTVSRIIIGFLSGMLLAVVLALLAGRFPIAEILLWPYMITVKSVPVASFIVIAFIWFSASNIAALISFLIVLPVVYTNLLEGIRSVDEKMLQMADVFSMPFGRRLHYIWLPSVKNYFISGVRISAGLAWKAGVAAELIGYPNGSVGESLYYAKQYFETADVFAWTIVIILLSILCEKLFVFALRKFFGRVEK